MSDLDAILTDSAAQVDRAAPVDYRIQTQNWTSPGEDWFEAFTETVRQQVIAAFENDNPKCPCCGKAGT